jgi:hypothetical protein
MQNEDLLATSTIIAKAGLLNSIHPSSDAEFFFLQLKSNYLYV